MMVNDDNEDGGALVAVWRTKGGRIRNGESRLVAALVAPWDLAFIFAAVKVGKTRWSPLTIRSALV